MNYTFEDYLTAKDKVLFVQNAVQSYRSSKFFKKALIADTYMKGENYTISKYQKLLATNDGGVLYDTVNPNYKLKTNIFRKIVTQRCSFLLGNGVSFTKQTSKRRFGKGVDQKIYDLAKDSLVQGKSYGFWNLDHLEIFKATEICPLYNSFSGELEAAIRFIKVDNTIFYTVYEKDGYWDMRDKNGKVEVYRELTPYIVKVNYVEATDTTTLEYDNYNKLPLVELDTGSLIDGLREQIDCYDLIKSGFANDLDRASQIYWILENCGGMDDLDVSRFIRQVKDLGAAVVDGDDGAKAEAHTIEVPYNSRETYLNILKNDIYDDAMALDTSIIAKGNITATQIKAAYEPLNEACDELEFKLDDFFEYLSELVSVNDTPIFNRSYISNQKEQVDMVMAAKDVLPKEIIVKHLPFLTVDEIDQIIKDIDSTGQEGE